MTPDTSRSGQIFVHVNPAFEAVRVSRTDVDPAERISSRDGSGESFPFVKIFSRAFVDVERAEATLHQQLAPWRASEGPNFFTVPATEVIDRLRTLEGGIDSPSSLAPVEPWKQEVQALIDSGQKLMAIKVYREATGLGLKESKDVIDRMAGPAKQAGCASGCAVMACASLAAFLVLSFAK